MPAGMYAIRHKTILLEKIVCHQLPVIKNYGKIKSMTDLS